MVKLHLEIMSKALPGNHVGDVELLKKKKKNRKISGKGFGIFGLQQFSMSKVKTKYSFSIPRTLCRTILKGAFL